MSRKSDSLIAFAAGVLAGTAIGILFAPDKGSNTRDKLTYNLDKYRSKLMELIEQLGQEKELPSTAAKAEGQKIINAARNKAERLLVDVESLMDEIKTKTAHQE